MFAASVDDDQIIARVGALDIGKAELVCCVPVPGPAGLKRRVQEVTTHSTMTRAYSGILPDLAGFTTAEDIDTIAKKIAPAVTSMLD